MIQNSENGEKPNLGLLGLNLSQQIFFIKLVVTHCSKLSPYAI